MVGGHDHERVLGARELERGLDGARQLDGLAERAEGVVGVVRVVDAARLDHQHEALRRARQHAQRGGRHLAERRLAAAVGGAVGLVLHVARVEEAEETLRLREVERLELRAAPHVGAARVPLLPLGGEVAAVLAQAAELGLLGVALRRRQELRAAAAEHDLDAVAGAELDELARDVGECRRRAPRAADRRRSPSRARARARSRRPASRA